jgi:hypothetical protein
MLRGDCRHPPGTATPRQPARLPPRRLTARSTHRHHHHHHQPAAATPKAARTLQTACPHPENEPAHQPEPMSDAAGTIRNGHRTSSVGTTPAVLSVTQRGGDGNRTRVQGFAGPCLSHSATPPQGACRKGIRPFESGRRDSNPRPSPWQGDALPTEPRPRRTWGAIRTVADPAAYANSNRAILRCPSKDRWVSVET